MCVSSAQPEIGFCVQWAKAKVIVTHYSGIYKLSILHSVSEYRTSLRPEAGFNVKPIFLYFRFQERNEVSSWLYSHGSDAAIYNNVHKNKL